MEDTNTSAPPAATAAAVVDCAIPVYDSKQQYLNILQNLNIPYKDPRNIDDLITAKSTVYSKLKFQYLEQETKDAFLRLIIENKPQYIEESQLANLVSTNTQLKQELKVQKQKSETMFTNLETISIQVATDAKELMNATTSNQQLMADILNLNDEITELIDVTDAKEKEFNMDLDDTIITHISHFTNTTDLSMNNSIANSSQELAKLIEQKNLEIEQIQLGIDNQLEENKAISLTIQTNINKSKELESKKSTALESLQQVLELKQNQAVASSDESQDQEQLLKLEKLGKKLAKSIVIWSSCCSNRINVEEINDQDNVILMRIDEYLLKLKFFNDERLKMFMILSATKQNQAMDAAQGADLGAGDEDKDQDMDDFIERCNYDQDCISYFINHI